MTGPSNLRRRRQNPALPVTPCWVAEDLYMASVAWQMALFMTETDDSLPCRNPNLAVVTEKDYLYCVDAARSHETQEC